MTDTEIETPPIDTGDLPAMDFTAGPAEPEQPKRRGRPPLSQEEKDRRAAERAATGARPRGRPRGKVDLTGDIAGTLKTINFVFLFVPEEYKGDALTDEEILELAYGLNHAAQSNATMHKYLTMVLKGSGIGTWLPLLTAVGGIVKKRMDNHGVTFASLLGTPRIVEAEYAETPDNAYVPV